MTADRTELPPEVDDDAEPDAAPGVRQSANAWWCPVDDRAMQLHNPDGDADPCDVCGLTLRQAITTYGS